MRQLAFRADLDQSLADWELAEMQSQHVSAGGFHDVGFTWGVILGDSESRRRQTPTAVAPK